MRTLLVMCCAISLLVGSVGTSNATLIAVGGGDYVYDDVQDRWWLADLNTFDSMTYAEQMTAIAAFTHDFGGTWTMAESNAVMSTLWNNGQAAIEAAFTPNGVGPTYNGRTDISAGSGQHYAGTISYGFDLGWASVTEDSAALDPLGAWVYTDTNPIPEPTTALLLGIGFAGLAAAGRRRSLH